MKLILHKILKETSLKRMNESLKKVHKELKLLLQNIQKNYWKK
jgi:hypothetical protein